jgi:hypothetical protein
MMTACVSLGVAKRFPKKIFEAIPPKDFASVVTVTFSNGPVIKEKREERQRASHHITTAVNRGIKRSKVQSGQAGKACYSTVLQQHARQEVNSRNPRHGFTVRDRIDDLQQQGFIGRRVTVAVWSSGKR